MPPVINESGVGSSEWYCWEKPEVDVFAEVDWWTFGTTVAVVDVADISDVVDTTSEFCEGSHEDESACN